MLFAGEILAIFVNHIPPWVDGGITQKLVTGQTKHPKGCRIAVNQCPVIPLIECALHHVLEERTERLFALPQHCHSSDKLVSALIAAIHDVTSPRT
jgi:hypothetical protein